MKHIEMIIDYIDKFEREVMNGQQFDKASGCD